MVYSEYLIIHTHHKCPGNSQVKSNVIKLPSQGEQYLTLAVVCKVTDNSGLIEGELLKLTVHMRQHIIHRYSQT